MLYHKKNKIKLSLIDDFIQISLISNFCCSVDNFKVSSDQILLNENLNLVLKLKDIYMSVVKKLKLYDTPFIILVSELNKNNTLFEKEKCFNFKNINQTLEKMKKVLTQISAELDSKLKLLT